MSSRNNHYLVRVRPVFQIAGILLGAVGVLIMVGVWMKYDQIVAELGVELLAIMLGIVVPFLVFVSVCATIGRLPYWIARRLPEEVLHAMKDHRNIDDPVIK